MCTQSNEYIQYSPVKYAHDFVVLLVLFQMGSYDLYIHIPHNCCIGTEPVVKSVIVNSYENNTEVQMTSSTSLHHIQSLFMTLHVATWLIAMDELIYCFHILQNGPKDCKDVTRPQFASSRIWKYTMICHAVVSVHRTSWCSGTISQMVSPTQKINKTKHWLADEIAFTFSFLKFSVCHFVVIVHIVDRSYS